jgi:hypothetical protein
MSLITNTPVICRRIIGGIFAKLSGAQAKCTHEVTFEAQDGIRSFFYPRKLVIGATDDEGGFMISCLLYWVSRI